MASGAPTLYSQELADRICKRIATTKLGLRAICKEEGMPCRDTIYEWLANNKEFSDQYARVKLLQADLLFEEIIEIADDTTNDTISGQYGETGNSVAVARARLQIDARKWSAGKLAPKKYGDKIDINHGGQDGENPILLHSIPVINIMNPHAGNEGDKANETAI